MNGLKSALILSSVMGLTLLGCNSGKVVSSCIRCPTEYTKYGLICNDFGPTDGPETRMLLTDSVVTCTHEVIFPRTSAQLHVNSLSEFQVGKNSTYTNRDAWHCDDANTCFDYGKLSFSFTDSTKTHMLGEYRIEKAGKAIESGRMELIKCPERPTCG